MQRNFGSSSFIKEELDKGRSSDGNACSKSQAIGKNDVHFKIEKTEYPTRSSADCPKDYESMNGIWTPELNIPSPNQNHLTRVPTDSYHPIKKEENITDMMCRLLKEQAAPQVVIEPFDVNLVNFTYFLSMFTEAVEKNIEDPMGRLTRLIKYTTGEAQEMIKHFINDKPEEGYKNAITLLKRQFGNPHRLLAAYRI